MPGLRSGAVALILGALTFLSACTPVAPGDGPTTAGPTATPTAVPASPATPEETLVYFPIDGPDGVRLVREPHGVAADDPVGGAIAAMIAGPTDPDYLGLWNPATRVLSVSDAGNTIIVDLSGEARTANVGSAAAALMKQQLIYTATEQLGDDKQVLLRIDGQPAGELWGAVDWTTPEPRADWSDTLLLVGIDTPAEGATVTSPVMVAGEAAVFEATLRWRVLATDGSIVAESSASTLQGMTMAPYRFQVPLPPGDYVVEVTEDDPSGGAGGPLDVDNRRITVTG